MSPKNKTCLVIEVPVGENGLDDSLSKKMIYEKILNYLIDKKLLDPEKIIKMYGADAVRLFILSDSPPEKDVQWSEEGIISSYKFIQKLWFLHRKIMNKINENNKIFF